MEYNYVSEYEKVANFSLTFDLNDENEEVVATFTENSRYLHRDEAFFFLLFYLQIHERELNKLASKILTTVS